jgi:crossover junction endodeoxyribonuclease RuvC
LQKPSKIILGIDPGTVIMGYGLVQCTGNRVSLIEMGVLKLPVHKDSYERLKLIHQKVHELIGRFAPQDFAIEAPFFGKNVQAITGNGNSEKQQVWKMLQRILELEEEITSYDASDAVAVAVCHHFQNQITERISGGRAPSGGVDNKPGQGGGRRKKPGSWEDFVRQNPGKVQPQ